MRLGGATERLVRRNHHQRGDRGATRAPLVEDRPRGHEVEVGDKSPERGWLVLVDHVVEDVDRVDTARRHQLGNIAKRGIRPAVDDRRCHGLGDTRFQRLRAHDGTFRPKVTPGCDASVAQRIVAYIVITPSVSSRFRP
jgi:hypothetical protein